MTSYCCLLHGYLCGLTYRSRNNLQRAKTLVAICKKGDSSPNRKHGVHGTTCNQLKRLESAYPNNSVFQSLFQVPQHVCKCLLVVITAFICLVREMSKEIGQLQVYCDAIELLTTWDLPEV